MQTVANRSVVIPRKRLEEDKTCSDIVNVFGFATEQSRWWVFVLTVLNLMVLVSEGCLVM